MTQIEAMCKLLVDDGHMTPLAARKVLQVAKIDADRIARVQALLTTPGFDDGDMLREALAGGAQ